MNYDKIKRSGILFLLGIGAITSLSCNDNDNGGYPERVPTRLSVMPLPERVDYKESVVTLPQNVTVSQNIPASTSQLLKSTLEEMTRRGGRDTEKDLYGALGNYRTILSKNTYHAPCPICGERIQKEAYLGGSIYYCPHCQRER